MRGGSINLKKIWLSLVGILLLISVLSISYSALANGQVNPPKEFKIQQINTDNTQPLKLNFEEYHSAFFEINPTNNTNHEDFHIKVSNIASGQYKVIITATNDYIYESKELINNITIPITNIEADITYRITIISTSLTPFKAELNITSKEEK